MRIFIFFLLILFYSSFTLAQVDAELLESETLKRFERVPEFAFIQEEANKLGIKVYLFGGTASAFAHYVRWDLEREAGDDKYQKERFDYDFTNIYRGNQDLDIVVDGTEKEANELKYILKNKYPHFVGNKDAWEIRLLRSQTSDKLPLLRNYDFLNQHTDTNSTGMLAINPDEYEVTFRDLFAWNYIDSQFLKDVAAGEIKFLFSKSHETTSRAKEGKNPPIFAATRYLAKLAQYEVKGTDEDLDIIRRIVRNTNWDEIKSNYYVSYKLEEFGKKVLLNAPDSEYAWNLLEDTGLRKKLIEIDKQNIGVSGSLSWWMSKEPLRSKEIGQGSGKTAKKLFNELSIKELIVSHETNSFHAYENITRSSKGKANAFISRDGINGEAAVFGDGFYTKIGKTGARGTGLTARFKLHPDAREGLDFIYEAGEYIIVRNKNALTLIQEDLNISLIDFIKLSPTLYTDSNNKGLQEKFLRKFSRISSTSQEFKKTRAFVRRKMLKHIGPKEKRLKFDLDTPTGLVDTYLWSKFMSNNFNDTEENTQLAVYILTQNNWNKHSKVTKWINLLIERNKEGNALISKILPSMPNITTIRMNKWMTKLLENKENHFLILLYLLDQDKWAQHSESPNWIEIILRAPSYNFQGIFVTYILGSKHWQESRSKPLLRSYFSDVLSSRRADKEILKNLLTSEYWQTQPEAQQWAQTILGRDDVNNDLSFVKHILTTKLWRENPVAKKWLKTILDKGLIDSEIVEHLLSTEFWSNQREFKKWLQDITERGRAGSSVIKYILSKPEWSTQNTTYKIIKKILSTRRDDGAILDFIFLETSWPRIPTPSNVISRNKNKFKINKLSGLLKILILRGNLDLKVNELLSKNISIKKYLQKKYQLDDRELTAQNLRKKYRRYNLNYLTKNRRNQNQYTCKSLLIEI